MGRTIQTLGMTCAVDGLGPPALRTTPRPAPTGAAVASFVMTLTVQIEQETDGRWIAEVVDLPGTLAYGVSPEEATAKVKALALRVLADRLEHGETDADLGDIAFVAA